MKLEAGKFYKIVFSVGGNILTFSCQILEEDDNFVRFKDKFGKILCYNKANIVSVEEIEGGAEYP